MDFQDYTKEVTDKNAIFEVLMVVSMTPCYPVEVYRRFGGMCRLQIEALIPAYILSNFSTLGSYFNHEVRGRSFLQNLYQTTIQSVTSAQGSIQVAVYFLIRELEYKMFLSWIVSIIPSI
jgi:hypothetical protein